MSPSLMAKIRYRLQPIEDIFRLGYHKIFKNGTFSFNGKALSYFYSLHNKTFQNERAVEIPIVLDLLRAHARENILEVGNVMAHYGITGHTVIDKYERGSGVLNYDVVDYTPDRKYEVIVSISTLEHVGWDEYVRYGGGDQREVQTPELFLKAVERLKQILAPGGVFLATMPMGFNKFIDTLVEEGRTGFTDVRFLKRVTADNVWRQAAYPEVKGIAYGSPYPCANGLIVAEFRR